MRATRDRVRSGGAGQGVRVVWPGLLSLLWLLAWASETRAGVAVPPIDYVPTDSVAGDSVPTLEESGVLPVEVSAEAVTEAAWSGGGGVLQVMKVGVESELSTGLRLHIQLQGKWGHGGASFSSQQGLSSLDAEDFGGAGEAWLEWRGGDLVRLKAGRVDANSEFAAAESAGGFANPSFGLSPLLGLLPSYPSPAPSANLFVRPWSEGPVAGVGAYRRGDGSWAGVAEVRGAVPHLPALRWSAGWVEHLGASPGEAGEGAGYLVLERSGKGVTPFVMVAGAGGDGARHVAGGVSLPFPGSWLVAEAGVGASGVMGGAPGATGEAVAEAFLAVRPFSWLRIQGDGQLLLARGEDPALAGLVRVAVTY